MNKQAVKQFNECLKEFDFEQVEKVMNFLDWKWADISRPPVIEEMKVTCWDLFLDAFQDYLNTGKEMIMSTGGFEVGIYDNYVVLKFVLAEWFNDDDS